MKWLIRWRLEALREQLVVVDAAIAAEAEIVRKTGTLYPIVYARNAKERASLRHRIARLESKLKEQP